MRIVLDTNVLVAAFLNAHSHAARILRLVLQGRVGLVADARILDEYEEVLARPKFKLPAEDVAVVMGLLRMRCVTPPAVAGTHDLPDKDDAPFVEAAVSGMADFIVTGNRKHYPARCCRGVEVLSPAEFVGRLER